MRTLKIDARCSGYNEEMLRVILPILVAAAIFGQTPPAPPEKAFPQASQTAPPAVDAALRARIIQFYQLQVDGKFRQAEQLVAEDTKDLYVGSTKPSYQSFEIQTIRFSDDFTKAEAMVLVHRTLLLEGFIGHPLPMKLFSHWKLEDGQWCYYEDQQKNLSTTPFGPFARSGMAVPPPAQPGAPRPLPPMQGDVPNPHMLTTDKTIVQLKSSGPSAEQVAISNPWPWPAVLTLYDPKVAGLSVKLDNLTVKPRDKAILSIRSSGDAHTPTTPITIVVTVQQTNQTIKITVYFAN